MTSILIPARDREGDLKDLSPSKVAIFKEKRTESCPYMHLRHKRREYFFMNEKFYLLKKTICILYHYNMYIVYLITRHFKDYLWNVITKMLSDQRKVRGQ